MAEIIVKFEDKIIERIVTEKKRISIGRTQDNDIVLENRGVSRKHAMIEFNDTAAVIIDNESLNGTFVNNRKIHEEVLRDDDIITIGKYALIYHKESQAGGGEAAADMDGTMVLNTKRQRDMIDNDRLERQIVAKYGTSVLIGEENTDFSEYRIDREVTTIGKAKFAHIRVGGFFVAPIQAKIVAENNVYSLLNLGKRGKVKVNGDIVDKHVLRNGDLITVGNSSFKFLDGKQA